MTSTFLKAVILAAVAVGVTGCNNANNTPAVADPNNSKVPKLAIDPRAAANDEAAGKRAPAAAAPLAVQGGPSSPPQVVPPPR